MDGQVERRSTDETRCAGRDVGETSTDVIHDVVDNLTTLDATRKTCSSTDETSDGEADQRATTAEQDAIGMTSVDQAVTTAERYESGMARVDHRETAVTDAEQEETGMTGESTDQTTDFVRRSDVDKTARNSDGQQELIEVQSSREMTEWEIVDSEISFKKRPKRGTEQADIDDNREAHDVDQNSAEMSKRHSYVLQDLTR